MCMTNSIVVWQALAALAAVLAAFTPVVIALIRVAAGQAAIQQAVVDNRDISDRRFDAMKERMDRQFGELKDIFAPVAAKVNNCTVCIEESRPHVVVKEAK